MRTNLAHFCRGNPYNRYPREESLPMDIFISSASSTKKWSMRILGIFFPLLWPIDHKQCPFALYKHLAYENGTTLMGQRSRQEKFLNSRQESLQCSNFLHKHLLWVSIQIFHSRQPQVLRGSPIERNPLQLKDAGSRWIQWYSDAYILSNTDLKAQANNIF